MTPKANAPQVYQDLDRWFRHDAERTRAELMDSYTQVRYADLVSATF